MSSHRSTLSAVLPLFLVLFIDGMGLGIIFPILNPIYMDPIHGILGATTTEAARAFYYGLTLFVFPACMFFATPILGDLSDSIGRKKVLLICLLGAASSYFITAMGVYFHAALLIIIGRMVAGFTAGSQAVAQAAIIDVAPADKKALYLGWLMLPVSFGFVAGPLISGYMADANLVSWFNLTTPLYFACLFSLCNALYLLFAFTNPRAAAGQVKLKLHQAVGLFLVAFKHPKMRILSLAYLAMNLGWAVYFQYVSFYLMQHFNYNGQMLGLFMGTLSLGFALGFTLTTKYLFKYFSYVKGVALSWFIAAIGVVVTVAPPVAWPAWFAAILIGLFIAPSYSGILTLYSHTVDETRQGWAMGVASSVGAVGFAIMSIVPSWLSQLAAWVPLTCGAIFLLICAIIMLFYREVQA